MRFEVTVVLGVQLPEPSTAPYLMPPVVAVWSVA
jgi:hypothetical protein